jgi:hypothetical protein
MSWLTEQPFTFWGEQHNQQLSILVTPGKMLVNYDCLLLVLLRLIIIIIITIIDYTRQSEFFIWPLIYTKYLNFMPHRYRNHGFEYLHGIKYLSMFCCERSLTLKLKNWRVFFFSVSTWFWNVKTGFRLSSTRLLASRIYINNDQKSIAMFLGTHLETTNFQFLPADFNLFHPRTFCKISRPHSLKKYQIKYETHIILHLKAKQ